MKYNSNNILEYSELFRISLWRTKLKLDQKRASVCAHIFGCGNSVTEGKEKASKLLEWKTKKFPLHISKSYSDHTYSVKLLKTEPLNQVWSRSNCMLNQICLMKSLTRLNLNKNSILFLLILLRDTFLFTLFCTSETSYSSLKVEST